MIVGVAVNTAVLAASAVFVVVNVTIFGLSLYASRTELSPRQERNVVRIAIVLFGAIIVCVAVSVFALVRGWADG